MTAVEGVPMPDGELAVTVEDDLYMMGADGSAPRRLASGRPQDLQWSPDGSEILFVREVVEIPSHGGLATVTLRGLFVVNVVTGNERKITRGDYPDLHPRWSPDGKWIAFQRSDDSLTVRVVSASDTEEPMIVDDAAAHDPSWSPNGQTLAYTSDRNSLNSTIRISDLDGPPRDLAVPRERLILYEPVWHPSGHAVLARWIDSDLQTMEYEGGFAIIDVREPHGKMKRIQAGRQAPKALAVSPDGLRVAYAINERDVVAKHERTNLRIVSIGGTEDRTITNVGWGTHYGPTELDWSADGEYLLTTRYDEVSNDSRVVAFHMATGKELDLTHPSWRGRYNVGARWRPTASARQSQSK